MFISDFAEKFKWLQQRVQDSETELKEKGKYETSRLWSHGDKDQNFPRLIIFEVNYSFIAK